MKLAKEAEIIAEYWKSFSNFSEYKLIIEEKLSGSLLLTEDGKIAGAYAQNKSSNGTIILLPFLNSNADVSFGEKFVESIMEIDKALNPVLDVDNNISESKIELVEKIVEPSPKSLPMPSWLDDPLFDLPHVTKLKEESVKIESTIEELKQQKEQIELDIINEGRYKRLLFEKGDALEEMILNSLVLMGFEFSTSSHTGPGLDVSFQDEQARYIGEVVGMDNEAIGFDTLRQLEMKILEDYSNDDVEEIAKGILFGNAYRQQELKSRGDFFTTKCMAAAKKNRIALIRTQDLFEVVKHLSDNKDEKYAKKCREAILNSEGEIVKFPGMP